MCLVKNNVENANCQCSAGFCRKLPLVLKFLRDRFGNCPCFPEGFPNQGRKGPGGTLPENFGWPNHLVYLS